MDFRVTADSRYCYVAGRYFPYGRSRSIRLRLLKLPQQHLLSLHRSFNHRLRHRILRSPSKNRPFRFKISRIKPQMDVVLNNGHRLDFRNVYF